MSKFYDENGELRSTIPPPRWDGQSNPLNGWDVGEWPNASSDDDLPPGYFYGYRYGHTE